MELLRTCLLRIEGNEPGPEAFMLDLILGGVVSAGLLLYLLWALLRPEDL